MWLSPQCEGFSESIAQILLVLIDNCEKCLPFTHGSFFTHDFKNPMICPLHLNKNIFYLWLIFYRAIFSFSSIIFRDKLHSIFTLWEGNWPSFLFWNQLSVWILKKMVFWTLVKELVSNLASLRNSLFFSFSNPCLNFYLSVYWIFVHILWTNISVSMNLSLGNNWLVFRAWMPRLFGLKFFSIID